ncbi:MAG: hypothetical protein JNK87_39005 [Bryobacterales bacterium]|nr:hypothetical protein [Bryobacterales bacterium]
MADLKALQSYLEYQKQAIELENTARKEIQERFRVLLEEAAQLALTYKKTFGGKLETPKSVKAFAVVETGRGAAKPAKKKAAAPAAAAAPPPPPPVDLKKLNALKKSLATAEEKLAASGDEKEKRRLQDKIYMIEDEIRLLTNPPQ